MYKKVCRIIIAMLLVMSVITPGVFAYTGQYYSTFHRINNMGYLPYINVFNLYRNNPVIDKDNNPDNSKAPQQEEEKNTVAQPSEVPAETGKKTEANNAQWMLSDREKEMLNYINEERAKAGLAPLKVDPELSRVARIKSQDMVDNGYFSHVSPTYGSPFEMMKSFGIKYRAAGENIARNSSVLKAHVALMNSEGHRKNILSKTFTHIGIGIVDNKGVGGITVTQMFIAK